jgi:hypothetical protein
LRGALGNGLARAERESRVLALLEFDELAKMAGFLQVGEELLGSLLENDGLVTEREECVFEVVKLWMKAGVGGRMRGSGLEAQWRAGA